MFRAEVAAAGREVAANAAALGERMGVAAEQQKVSELHVLSAEKGLGNDDIGTAAFSGAGPIGSTGGAGRVSPHHQLHSAPETLAIGRLGSTSTMKDPRLASGDGESVGVNVHPFTCGVAEDAAVWFSATSVAANVHHGTAAKDAQVVPGKTDGSDHSPSLVKRPEGSMSSPSATPYGDSCPFPYSSYSKDKYPEQHKTLKSRPVGGKHETHSGSAGPCVAIGSSKTPWGANSSTELLWGRAGFVPECAPTLWVAPGSSEALDVLSTTKPGKAGGRWSSPVSAEGAWVTSSATAAATLAAEVREEEARVAGPTESNISGRRCLDDGAGGVEYHTVDIADRGYALRPVLCLSDSSTNGMIGREPSVCGVAGKNVASSTCIQTVVGQSTPRPKMMLSSSVRQTPLSRTSLSLSFSRSMPDNHSASSAAQISSSLHHLSSSCRANGRQQPLPPPHTFRGVSILAEALAHDRPDAIPAYSPQPFPPPPQLGARRLATAEVSLVGRGAICETTTSHSSWVNDLRCSVADGTGEKECGGENEVGTEVVSSSLARQQQHPQQEGHEGVGVRDGDGGADEVKFNGSVSLPHDHAVTPSNTTATLSTSLPPEQQLSHRDPPLYPPPDSIDVRSLGTSEEKILPTWDTSNPRSAGVNLAHGPNDGGDT